MSVTLYPNIVGGGASSGGGDASAANQATQITNQSTQITAEQAEAAVLGAITGAAVVTDANGTVQQYLRGLVVKMLALIALFPASLGAKSAAASLSVANANDSSSSNASTATYAASLIVKASAGALWGVSGYNSNIGVQFIQLFDSATLPAEGAVPKIVLAVAGGSAFSFDFGVRGRAFASGIVLCNSSTGPTKTIGSADCWFDAQYN